MKNIVIKIKRQIKRKRKKDNKGKIKLTGIGEYEMLGCNQVVLNEDLSMYTLAYRGTHFAQPEGLKPKE